MQIFKFDPLTGRKGSLIRTDRVFHWTAASVQWAFEQGNLPADFPMPVLPKIGGQEWGCHVDAGCSEIVDGKLIDISYLCDDWICFCGGEVHAGEDDTYWDWIVLPPQRIVEVEKPLTINDLLQQARLSAQYVRWS